MVYDVYSINTQNAKWEIGNKFESLNYLILVYKNNVCKLILFPYYQKCFGGFLAIYRAILLYSKLKIKN
jgi:hypothetical protein